MVADVTRYYDADLGVMQSHERTGVKLMLTGSVPEYVVSVAPCPMLIFEGDSDFPSEGVDPMIAEAKAKYELLDAIDHLKVVRYSGCHGQFLRDETKLTQIARWFHHHMACAT